MEVIFKIRKPIVKPEKGYILQEQLIIDKIYPSFRPVQQTAIMLIKAPLSPSKIQQSPVQEEVKSKTRSVPKSLQKNEFKTKSEPKSISKSEPSVVTQTQVNQEEEKLDDLPPTIRPIDVSDPDNADNLIVASYLSKRIAAFTTAINRLTEKKAKIPEALKDKLMLMTKNNGELHLKSKAKNYPSKHIKAILKNSL